MEPSAAGADVDGSMDESAALYWVTDEPLLQYLGVAPIAEKFAPTLFEAEKMERMVEEISHAAGAEHKNRTGVLLGRLFWDPGGVMIVGGHQRVRVLTS